MNKCPVSRSSSPAADNVSSMTPATTIQYEISRDRWLGNILQCDLRTHVVYDRSNLGRFSLSNCMWYCKNVIPDRWAKLSLAANVDVFGICVYLFSHK